MSEFFVSLRADLTDRRLLPAVSLVAVCLLAAIGYAALGGSGASSSPAPSGGSVATPTPGISVIGTKPEHAIAETTDGFKEQAAGKARNPFAALPSAVKPGTGASSSAGSAAGSSGSSGSGQGSEGSTGSSPTGGAAPESGGKSQGEGEKQSTKPKTVYDVAIEFGTLPPGTTPETAQLTPYAKLKLQTLLPSAQLPLLIFRGVTTKGRTATFQLAGEAILSGTGHCLPSAAQCEAVDLKPGQTEQLSYLAADGQTTVYELRVLSIAPEKAKASTAKAGGWAESIAGRELLRHDDLVTLPILRYSSQPGVLIFPTLKVSAARARTALVKAAG